MWFIWHKTVAVNKWRAKIAPASISKIIIFLILVNRSHTSFGIVSKPGGFGGKPPTPCMNFAGSGPAITTLSVGLKPCSEKKILNGMRRWAKFGTSWEVLSFGLFGLNAMTKFSTTNNGIKRKSNTRFERRLSTSHGGLEAGFGKY